MKRLLLFVLLPALAVTAACTKTTPPTPTSTPERPIAGVATSAVLNDTDVGTGWKKAPSQAPTTLQIGGRVGPGNITDPEQSATSSYDQINGTGSITNSVFVMRTQALAQAVMAAHNQADTTTTWTQDRVDGGKSDFTNAGPIASLPSLGDEMYTARIKGKITDAAGKNTDRAIEYVAYRIGRVVAFVVTQDVGASVYARRQEPKVAQLTS